MRKELDEKLCKDYPEIFKDRRGNMQETAMCWGFECGDGWYSIIDFLCTGLMNDVKRARHKVKFIEKEMKERKDDLGRGLYNEKTLAKAKEELLEAEKNIPVAVQVKEKFGGLRFYVSGGTDKHHEMISMVEALSYRVCEECSTMVDVERYSIGYMRTLCAKHADEQYGDEAENYRKGKTNE
jgi:hypothetical protein